MQGVMPPKADTPPAAAGVPAWRSRAAPVVDSQPPLAVAALGRYAARDFRADAFAALAVTTLAVPQSMAYALVAGLPPQYGLYSAVVLGAVGSLFGSCRHLVTGPTNAISVAVLATLAPLPTAERLPAAAALAFLVGFIQFAIGLCRPGDLTRFISAPVMAGFTAGVGLTLAWGQLRYLCVTPGSGPGGWLQLRGPTAALGIVSVALVVATRRLNRRRGWRLPDFLVAVAGTGILAWSFGFAAKGVETIGTVPPGMPSFQLPALRGHLPRELAGNAFAVAMIGLFEALLMGKALAARTGQALDVGRECRGQGLANLAGSFFQCYPGSGSFSRSAVNYQAGAATRWSGVMAAAAVAVVVLACAPLAGHIPRAAFAGILIVSAWTFIDVRGLRRRLRAAPSETPVLLATAAAVFFSVGYAILIGMALSWLLSVFGRAGRLPHQGPYEPWPVWRVERSAWRSYLY